METNILETTAERATKVVITPEEMLEHWQGHRRLTRKVIEAFPESELYSFSIGGMRTFSEMIMELIDLAGPGIKGIATGDWSGYADSGDFAHSAAPKTKEDVLNLWDSVTEKLNTYWPQVPAGRLQERDVAFGKWESPVYATTFYFIDNEIHHRAQGVVYLRALGIEPPAFWDRS